jgi:transglutaminase-like putative cysteine protease
MRLLRRFPLVAFATVLLGIVGFCVADHSVGLLLVAGVLAALSWYVTEGPRSRWLPIWTANVLLLAVVLNVAVDLARNTHDVLGVLGRFCLWLTLIKLYQRKSPRDYAQLMGLSLLLVLLGAARSGEILFGAVLVLYAAAGIYALMLFQLHAAFERSREGRLAAQPSGEPLVGSTRPVFGRRVRGQFVGLVSTVALGGFVLAAGVFVIYPRELGRDLVAGPTGGGARSGFSDEVNLAGVSIIRDSRRVVMVARGFEEPGRSGQPLRLRGAVLDRYEGGGRWRTSFSELRRFLQSEPPGFALLGAGDTDLAGSVDLSFEILAPGATLFSIYAPMAVATPDLRNVSYDPLTQTVQYADTGVLRYYTIRAHPDPSDELLEWLCLGQLPPDPAGWDTLDERVSALARQWLGESGLASEPPAEPETRWRWNLAGAQAFVQRFHTGKFEYRTDLSDVTFAADGQDPIVQFLLETRRGHCEFFASGLAALCNSVGIPARLVTGYVTLEYDPQDKTYLVRESDAHAWVEVRTGEYRWRTVDPTPPGTLRSLHAPPRTLTARFRAWADRMEAAWVNDFIAFDRRTQERVLGALDLDLADRLPQVLEATRAWMARVNRAFYFGPAGYIWMGIVGLALVIAMVALVHHVRRNRRLRVTLDIRHARGLEYQRLLRQLGFYLDMLRVLPAPPSRRGSPPWPTPARCPSVNRPRPPW